VPQSPDFGTPDVYQDEGDANREVDERNNDRERGHGLAWSGSDTSRKEHVEERNGRSHEYEQGSKPDAKPDVQVERLHRCHAETSISPYRHIRVGSEEGDNSLPGQQDEPRQGAVGTPNPVGDKARRELTAEDVRASPGRAARPKKGLLPFPHYQGLARPGMARTSFLQAVSAYLDAMKPYYQASTIERYGRDLRTAYRDLSALGPVKSPTAISESDIEALLYRWRTRPSRFGGLMGPASQEKLLVVLDGFLQWCGNPAISNLRRKRHVRLPRAVATPIRVLNDEDLERLLRCAEGVEGWPGIVSRFLVAFLPATGLRPKEIRLARLRDLELDKGRILVSHPKGEGSWAAPDYAPILSFAREAVVDFLVERTAYLDGRESESLIPYCRASGEIGPWSAAMLRKLKADLQDRSGVSFSGLKTFRATFAQRAIDGGARVEAVSRAMRHGSTKTTERYYARIRADNAFAEIERALARPALRVEAK